MSDLKKIEMFACFLDSQETDGACAAKRRGWVSSEGHISPLGKELLKAFEDQFGTQGSYRTF